jgi:ketosteroid isomerase-like protein
MSQENVEAVRRGFEAINSGDFEFIDPEIEWDISTHPLPDVPNRGSGREAFITDMFATYMRGWNDYTSEINEVSEVGDAVMLILHETATMRDTGVPLERDLVQLWTVRAGKGVFLRVFKTKEQALEAAGMRE